MIVTQFQHSLHKNSSQHFLQSSSFPLYSLRLVFGSFCKLFTDCSNILSYREYRRFQKAQQIHGSFRSYDNHELKRTLYKVSVISIICQFCFLIRSALLSFSLIADEFGFTGAIAGLIVDLLAGVLMTTGASVQIKQGLFDSGKLFETDPLLHS